MVAPGPAPTPPEAAPWFARWWRSLPYWVALTPLLFAWNQHVDQVPAAWVVEPVVMVLLATAWLHLLSARLLQRDVAAVLVAAVAAVILLAKPLWLLARFVTGPVLLRLPRPGILLLLLLLLAVALATRWLLRHPTKATGLAKAATVAAVALVVVNGGGAVAGSIGDGGDAALAVPATATAPLPDIYVIILDGHASPAVLWDFFDYDATPFVAALEARGFAVDPDARGAHASTILSMGAMLNMQTASALAPADSRSWKPAFRSAEDAVAPATLDALGYYRRHLSSGFGPTDTDGTADEPDLCASSNDYDRLLYERSILALATALGGPTPGFVINDQADRINCGFDVVPDAHRHAPPGAPVATLAHFIAPHPPYVFEADGSPSPGADPTALDEWADKDAYIAQMTYMDNRLLGMIDDIVAADPDAVIVIQSDHGPASHHFLERFETVGVATIPDDWHTNATWLVGARERMGILNAWRMPHGAPPPVTDAGRLPGTINVYRAILGAYTNADLPLLPERHLYSAHDFLYDFADVTDLLPPQRDTVLSSGPSGAP